MSKIAQWSVTLTAASIAAYISAVSTIPAIKYKPTPDGKSFISIFIIKAMISMLALIPAAAIACAVWPKMRSDLVMRSTTWPTMKFILISVGAGIVAQLLFARSYSLGVDVEVTRHLNAIMIILIPILYQCINKNSSKKFTGELGIGLVILALGSALIMDDHRNNK